MLGPFCRPHDGFICRNFIPNKISSLNIICNFIYCAKGISFFQLWEFNRSCPFAGNKQSLHIVGFLAERARVHVILRGTRDHLLYLLFIFQYLNLAKMEITRFATNLFIILIFTCMLWKQSAGNNNLYAGLQVKVNRTYTRPTQHCKI